MCDHVRQDANLPESCFQSAWSWWDWLPALIYSAGLALAMLWGVSFFELHMSLVQASFARRSSRGE